MKVGDTFTYKVGDGWHPVEFNGMAGSNFDPWVIAYDLAPDTAFGPDLSETIGYLYAIGLAIGYPKQAEDWPDNVFVVVSEDPLEAVGFSRNQPFRLRRRVAA